MKIVESPRELQTKIRKLKNSGKKIAFVPTMGNLHAGHLSLIKLARKHADIVVCSIFVNPLQFGPNEDLDAYPRTLQEDIEKLRAHSTDFLFTPSDKNIYPLGKEKHTSVVVNRMTENLCGTSRPGHFLGVTTVVNILFNIVQPDCAIFGKKDYQQYLLIKAMVNDLMLPIDIIGGEIVREDNGLAMSSRNGYMTEVEKENASLLRKIILQTAHKIKQGLPIKQCINQAVSTLTENDFTIDYFEVIRSTDLQPASTSDKELLIAAAAWLGKPRILDNLEFEISH